MERNIPKKARHILRLLANGEILKFRRSSRGYFKIISDNPSVWTEFHRKTLLYAINLLYRKALLDINEGLDGITAIAVTEAGTRIADTAGLVPNSVIRPSEWDKKWRLVLFDVPESKKKRREAFRYHLRRMGFTEFKRSALIFPFPCAKEVDVLAERLNIRENVVMITAESISDEFRFKKHFSLL